MTFRRWLLSPVLHDLKLCRLFMQHINTREVHIMATLQELVALVKAVRPAVDAFEARITALIKAELSPEKQALVDEAFADLRGALDDAADGVDEADTPPVDTPAA